MEETLNVMPDAEAGWLCRQAGMNGRRSSDTRADESRANPGADA